MTPEQYKEFCDSIDELRETLKEWIYGDENN
jgi:hypothetical protein